MSDADSISKGDDDFGDFGDPQPKIQPETTPAELNQNDGDDSFDDFGNFDDP